MPDSLTMVATKAIVILIKIVLKGLDKKNRGRT